MLSKIKTIIHDNTTHDDFEALYKEAANQILCNSARKIEKCETTFKTVGNFEKYSREVTWYGFSSFLNLGEFTVVASDYHLEHINPLITPLDRKNSDLPNTLIHIRVYKTHDPDFLIYGEVDYYKRSAKRDFFELLSRNHHSYLIIGLTKLVNHICDKRVYNPFELVEITGCKFTEGFAYHLRNVYGLNLDQVKELF